MKMTDTLSSFPPSVLKFLVSMCAELLEDILMFRGLRRTRGAYSLYAVTHGLGVNILDKHNTFWHYLTPSKEASRGKADSEI